MKKLAIAFGILATLVVALMVTGNVFAQGNTPGNPQTPGGGYGNGGMMGRHGMYAGTGEGIMHDTMIAAFAQELGISVEDLNARLVNGETMAQIATASGLTVEEFQAVMVAARSQAVDQAVADGTLTQEQADWMKQRGGGMMGTRMGGNARQGRGMRGANAGSMDCPYFEQSNP